MDVLGEVQVTKTGFPLYKTCFCSGLLLFARLKGCAASVSTESGSSSSLTSMLYIDFFPCSLVSLRLLSRSHSGARLIKYTLFLNYIFIAFDRYVTCLLES